MAALAASDRDDLTQPLLSGKKSQGFAPEGQGGRQRGHPTAGLGQSGMGEDVSGDEAAALALWTDQRRGSSQGTKYKTQCEPPAEPRCRLAQPRAATQHLAPPVSPPGWGEGAHVAPQALGTPRRWPSCAGHRGTDTPGALAARTVLGPGKESSAEHSTSEQGQP